MAARYQKASAVSLDLICTVGVWFAWHQDVGRSGVSRFAWHWFLVAYNCTGDVTGLKACRHFTAVDVSI